MTVLVLTRPDDSTADLVIAELNERSVRVHRLDPGDFPENLTVSARIGPDLTSWQGVLRGQHRDVSLSDIRSVYYRRPGAPRLHPDMSEQDARWAQAEAQAGFSGMTYSLPCLWVNHPNRNALATYPPVALAAAARGGLAVPRTLITNDPDQARKFVSALPGQVAAYKALGTTHPSDQDDRPQALWTTQVRPGEIDESVRRTAHQFQEWVDKAYEVRLTAVAHSLFAAEIHAGSDAARLDFRSDYGSLTFKPCHVPERIAGGVHMLMYTFGLQYVALDFLVNPQGHWYLVDVNPNGQWGFIPDLRAPITRALADLLERAHT
ncbi:RimK domain-containing protein ATP-grasp [Streptomyces bingchenggensis BCW-1]|uniref:RimK domain-containing protein ATP-grasp n=1 Tax=Streptomyces bingchenggensis (strain BCW-1) TaxID=749414 RepID=D7C997_STRBB|nr:MULTISPECIES: ATP-grasp ribosomal peptide maturase [Streptomyces]ADI10615.1 RimK domain-containing protein ATP-grasp [Streptomyces bingchenggensis BCW-1]